MSSIIEGYNYDIFISYRQKDNKHDGWVTEFVDNLKGELESTFKEEISVYFDINPHDGLLETHDVDASLKDKLKCLVFIPIISRTYCDPKSFAWEHEFKAFVELASQDQFGLKVKLPNGNVANRVLPVRIHDLDADDVKLFEVVSGSVMRTLDFVFKTASGAIRPLKAKEDHPNDNLNKTYYQDQINKVSLAIKEIITGISHYEQKTEEVPKEVPKPISIPGKNNKAKIIVGSVILLALIILGYFLIPKHSKPKEQLEKSIAVLPFTNLSNDPEQEYFSDGIVEAILDHLFKIGELKVTSGTSTKRYKKTELSVKEIGKELGVSSILEGSVQKIGNNVRITAQLIDARTDVHLWSETYDRNISDIFSIQSEVAQTVAKKLKATLTSKEKGQIEKNQTNNVEAYNLYLQGRFF
jgi:TolB-like protein